MIKVKNLTVSFDDKIVLKDISCVIEKSKITCIIGRSGEGKSVFMKTILGLIRPINGEIIVDGYPLNQLNTGLKTIYQSKSKIAMLFQNSALFDSMDVFQNIGFPLYEHYKLSYVKIKERVKEMLKLVDLNIDTIDKIPSELSGGMRKRVALARAIIQEPDYLIYDEPTTGLDPITAKEIVSLIENIHKKLSMTSIIITHEPDCIKQLSQNIIMINKGKIYFDGTYNKFKTLNHQIANAFLKEEKNENH